MFRHDTCRLVVFDLKRIIQTPDANGAKCTEMARGINVIGSVYNAFSGLSAFQKKMDVTANNVANVDTDGFKKSRTIFQEGSNSGVTVSIQQVDTPGGFREVIRNGGIEEVESSNVDLAEELTDTISTTVAYSANTKTIKVQDEMLGSVLDILG